MKGKKYGWEKNLNFDQIFLEFKKYLENNYSNNFQGENNTLKAYTSDVKQFINYFEQKHWEII